MPMCLQIVPEWRTPGGSEHPRHFQSVTWPSKQRDSTLYRPLPPAHNSSRIAALSQNQRRDTAEPRFHACTASLTACERDDCAFASVDSVFRRLLPSSNKSCEGTDRPEVGTAALTFAPHKQTSGLRNKGGPGQWCTVSKSLLHVQVTGQTTQPEVRKV